MGRSPFPLAVSFSLNASSSVYISVSASSRCFFQFFIFFSPPPLSRRLAEQSALPAPEANVHSQFSVPLRTLARTSCSRRSLQLPPFPLPPGAVPSGSLPFSSARRISFYRTSPRSSTPFFAFLDFFSRPARRPRTLSVPNPLCRSTPRRTFAPPMEVFTVGFQRALRRGSRCRFP
ncbi:hypothetical protein DGI_1182 [Megalodesulfovibrio gigas DSM 1382 = ATCC 19364]|uniref:Uncharacterized protein n=1 Tax=Megalodesulfovibrio gigas (strain ATCC 19364 / DSM 1382 / NCIMB 9332 / VKM B-1759) TaxID=1121448 RepID=T2G9T6_MEGG1|nr:hypothetical protein DGI_1182 [Megalodesulfovibrio gigas DSM 1382 = ATCC 19364]